MEIKVTKAFLNLRKIHTPLIYCKVISPTGTFKGV